MIPRGQWATVCWGHLPPVGGEELCSALGSPDPKTGDKGHFVQPASQGSVPGIRRRRRKAETVSASRGTVRGPSRPAFPIKAA